jgi:RNA polymerase-binding transcription factor DksA
LRGDPEIHTGDAIVETTAVLSATLEEVRDALQRLERADYGKCVECGQSIESARLRAVPWTPYCLEDQEKQDLKVQPEGASRWQSA